MSISPASSSPVIRTPAASQWWAHSGATALLLYELGWVIPCYLGLIDASLAPNLGRALLVLGLAHGGAYLAAAAMERLHLLRQVQWGVEVGYAALGLFVVNAALSRNPQGFMTAFFTLQLDVLWTSLVFIWLWYRGFTLAYDGLRPASVWRRFSQGLAGMMVYVFLAFQWGLPPLGLAWLIGFLFVGLLAVILTRIAFVWTTKGSLRSPFDRRWLLAISAMLLGMLWASGLLGSLLSGQYRMVIDMFSRLSVLLWTVLLFLFSLPVLFLSVVIYPVVAWLQALLANSRTIPPPEFGVAGGYPPPYPVPDQPPPAILVYSSTVLFWALVIGLVVFLLMRARKVIAARSIIEPESPEFILGKGEAGRMLRQALQDNLQNMVNRLRPARRYRPAQRVRRVYAALLELSAQRGSPRQPWQTPFEFLKDLRQAFPGQAADADLITEAYPPIRYGDAPEDPHQADAVEDAFERIKRAAEAE